VSGTCAIVKNIVKAESGVMAYVSGHDSKPYEIFVKFKDFKIIQKFERRGNGN
jgi:hypothetical protein